FPSPFISKALLFRLPVRPDFMGSGKFNGDSFVDLVIAQQGDSNLYIIPVDDKGKFGSPTVVTVPGRITAMATRKTAGAQNLGTVLVGITSPKDSSVLVFGGSDQGVELLGTFGLSAPATAFAFGNLNGDGTDAAILAGGNVSVLPGANLSKTQVAN